MKATVFKSLRENRNFSIAELCLRSKVAEEDLRAYETDDSMIALDTLERVAHVYKKRWTIFLLHSPEVLKKHGNDNRSHHNKTEVIDVDLINALDAAEYIIDTSAELGGGDGRSFPNVGIDISKNPGLYAEKLRSLMSVDEKQLLRQSDEFGALRFWKNLLTEYGLYISEMGWETQSVRAFSIVRQDRAIIVMSTKERPQPRTFSLFHELCHVLMKKPGICDLHEGGKDIEALCNAFAAGFLMPESSFRSLAAELGIKEKVMPTEEQLKGLRRVFATSRLATYRRLYTLGYITRPQYDTVQNKYEDWGSQSVDEDDGKKEKRKSKSQGGDYYRNQISKNGKRFTVEAFDAYANGLVTSRTLSRMLNVSVDNLNKLKSRVDGNGITSA